MMPVVMRGGGGGEAGQSRKRGSKIGGWVGACSGSWFESPPPPRRALVHVARPHVTIIGGRC